MKSWQSVIWGVLVVALLVGSGYFLFLSLGLVGDERVDQSPQPSPHEEQNWLIPIIDSQGIEFSSISELDGIFSDVVSDGESFTVTFEKPLQNGNDHTYYLEIVSGTPRAEIYSSGNKIAEFESLVDGENKVILSGLLQAEDVFEIKIFDGEVRFDYIVDPYSVSDSPFTCSNPVLQVPGGPLQTVCTITYQLGNLPGPADPFPAPVNLWATDDNLQIGTTCSPSPDSPFVPQFRLTNAVCTGSNCGEFGAQCTLNNGVMTCLVSGFSPFQVAWTLRACDVTQTHLDNAIGSDAEVEDPIQQVILDDTFDVDIIVPDITAPTLEYVGNTPAGGTYQTSDVVEVSVEANENFGGDGLQSITITFCDDEACTTPDMQSQNYPANTFFATYTRNFPSLTDGDYYFEAQAIDNAGNRVALEQRNVTIDTTDPVCSIPVNGIVPASPVIYSPTQDYTFTVDATDNIGIANTNLVFIPTAGSPYSGNDLGGGQYQHIFAAGSLDAGTYAYQWTITDLAGNTCVVPDPAEAYQINQAQGDVEVLLENAGLNLIAGDVTRELGDVVLYEVNVFVGDNEADVFVNSILEGSTVSGVFSDSLDTINYGVGTIEVEGVLAGSTNYLGDSQIRTVTVEDTTNPNVVISFPQEGATYSPPNIPVDRLEFTATDLDLSHCEYSMDDWVTTTSVSCTDGVLVNIDPLPSQFWADATGSYVWRVRAIDNSGNVFEDEVNFDILLPSIEVIFSPDLDANFDPPGVIEWDLVQQGEFDVALSAIGNNDDTDGVTDYYVDVTTVLTGADAYVRADGPLTHSGGIEIIPLANEQYSSSDSDSMLTGEPMTPLTTSYVQFDDGVAADTTERIYLKFFLEVPSGQPAGLYDNIVEFSFPFTGNSP